VISAESENVLQYVWCFYIIDW